MIDSKRVLCLSEKSELYFQAKGLCAIDNLIKVIIF